MPQFSNVLDIIGFILVIALVAVILTKSNTANDINAVGGQFTGAIKQAQAG